MTRDDWMRNLRQCGTPIVCALACAVGLVVFLALVKAHIDKNPLRADEVDYFQSMQNVLSLGLPLYYAGEVDLDPDWLIHLSTQVLAGRQFEFYRFKPETGILKETFFALTDGHSRYTYGMWHPPLYIYLGTLFLGVASLTVENSALLRYFNLIFSIGVLVGMVALSRELYGRRLGPTVALAVALYALNNLVIRGTILIDYNATLGPCVAVWFAAAYLRSERRRCLNVSLGLLTVLVFSTGLGIGVALLAGTLVYVAIVGRINRPWRALASIGIGFLAFFPMFLAFSRLLGLPFSQPFLHNIQRAGTRLDLTALAAKAGTAIEYSTGFYSREVGYPAILLGAGLLIRLFVGRQAFRTPQRVFVPIMVVVGFMVQGSLRADAYGFPKYILFLLPLLFVYMAGEALDVLFADSSSRIVKVVTGLVLAAVIVTQIVNSITALNRPGGTLYFAGEQGITAVSQRLGALTAADETIMSPKDVAFLAHRKFVQWYGTPLTDLRFLQSRLAAERIRYLASNTAMLSTASPDVATFLRTAFAIEAQDDDFRVLRAVP
jgi:hypothetical protein